MRLLYVPLEPDMLEQLLQLAAQERRRPQDQAAHLLERALRQARPRAGDAPGVAA